MGQQRPVSWFATRSRRPGPMRAAVELVLVDPGRFDPVQAELVRSAADLVDSAKRAQDPRLWLTASERLSRLLGLGHERGVGGAGSGDAAGVSPLAGLVGGPPEVRDVPASGAADVRAGDREGG